MCDCFSLRRPGLARLVRLFALHLHFHLYVYHDEIHLATLETSDSESERRESVDTQHDSHAHTSILNRDTHTMSTQKVHNRRLGFYILNEHLGRNHNEVLNNTTIGQLISSKRVVSARSVKRPPQFLVSQDSLRQSGGYRSPAEKTPFRL